MAPKKKEEPAKPAAPKAPEPEPVKIPEFDPKEIQVQIHIDKPRHLHLLLVGRLYLFDWPVHYHGIWEMILNQIGRASCRERV